MSAHDEASPPKDELDPDEPRTPLWLPLIGLCLFAAAFAYALVSQRGAPAAPAAVDSAAPAPSAAPE